MIFLKKERLNIIYEDKYIIVVEKPAKLLTVSTEKEKNRTLFHQLYEYVKKKNKNNKIFIVHRLDKDTSGLLIFAKDEITKRRLQDNWNDLVIVRGYIALVEGKVNNDGEVISYLKETKTLLTYSSNDKKNGKKAITKYKVLKSNNNYSLLYINILTGRKNQIRVHMNDINHPIVGDKKYGAKTNPIGRLGLHANVLKFYHPISNKIMYFELKLPFEFNRVI